MGTDRGRGSGDAGSSLSFVSAHGPWVGCHWPRALIIHGWQVVVIHGWSVVICGCSMLFVGCGSLFVGIWIMFVGSGAHSHVVAHCL